MKVFTYCKWVYEACNKYTSTELSRAQLQEGHLTAKQAAPAVPQRSPAPLPPAAPEGPPTPPAPVAPHLDGGALRDN